MSGGVGGGGFGLGRWSGKPWAGGTAGRWAWAAFVDEGARSRGPSMDARSPANGSKAAILGKAPCWNERQIVAVKKVWNELADAFLANPAVKEMKSRLSGAGRLEEWELELVMKFTETASLELMSRIITRIQRFMSEGDAPGAANALDENAFKSRAARFIVYGHTHRYKIVPLDYSRQGGQALNQFYVNSGTWRRVYELAQSRPADQEFLGYNVMTYLIFFKGDERGGRPFETWSGALACDYLPPRGP